MPKLPQLELMQGGYATTYTAGEMRPITWLDLARQWKSDPDIPKTGRFWDRENNELIPSQEQVRLHAQTLKLVSTGSIDSKFLRRETLRMLVLGETIERSSLRIHWASLPKRIRNILHAATLRWYGESMDPEIYWCTLKVWRGFLKNCPDVESLDRGFAYYLTDTYIHEDSNYANLVDETFPWSFKYRALTGHRALRPQ